VTAPDFSPLAADYARGRPAYPVALFDWIASESPGRRLAWDCATGNGQAAVGLAERFDRVIATDVSEAQLAHGLSHPRVDYRLATAEDSGLDAGSADVVTVAAAVHWFDLDQFQAEVSRVLRPGGLLVVWSYHVGRLEPPFDAIFHWLYFDLLAPYFADGARLVDRRYEDLSFDGEPVPSPAFTAEAGWSPEDAERFVASWSGTRAYRERHGEDPFERVRERLEALWDDPRRPLPVRFPLHLRAWRFGSAD
jgi:ubiquinone/menaquinone biosynthesis C-methylase UbiE